MRLNQQSILTTISKSQLLSKGFNYFVTHNTGISNPYHNLNHTLDLMYMINENVEEDEVYNKEKLLLLAMFHDFGHSAGKFSDDVNVENAISGLRAFLDKQGEFMSLEDIQAIEDTQFPYNNKPKTKEGEILRNFDNLQWIFDDFTTQALFGLTTEMQGTSMIDILDKYKTFVLDQVPKNITLEKAKRLYDDNIQQFINTCDTLLKIYKK